MTVHSRLVNWNSSETTTKNVRATEEKRRNEAFLPLVWQAAVCRHHHRHQLSQNGEHRQAMDGIDCLWAETLCHLAFFPLQRVTLSTNSLPSVASQSTTVHIVLKPRIEMRWPEWKINEKTKIWIWVASQLDILFRRNRRQIIKTQPFSQWKLNFIEFNLFFCNSAHATHVWTKQARLWDFIHCGLNLFLLLITTFLTVSIECVGRTIIFKQIDGVLLFVNECEYISHRIFTKK